MALPSIYRHKSRVPLEVPVSPLKFQWKNYESQTLSGRITYRTTEETGECPLSVGQTGRLPHQSHHDRSSPLEDGHGNGHTPQIAAVGVSQSTPTQTTHTPRHDPLPVQGVPPQSVSYRQSTSGRLSTRNRREGQWRNSHRDYNKGLTYTGNQDPNKRSEDYLHGNSDTVCGVQTSTRFRQERGGTPGTGTSQSREDGRGVGVVGHPPVLDGPEGGSRQTPGVGRRTSNRASPTVGRQGRVPRWRT